jgi:DNA modification methylase
MDLKELGIEPIGDEETDEVPEPPKEPRAQRGYVYALGPHQVMCGDSTSKEDVSALMGQSRADMVFTDPPYNVDYEGYTEDALKIKSDKMSFEDYFRFLCEVFQRYREAIKAGASLYVCHADAWQKETELALNAAGIEMRCQIIWAKNTFGWGFGRYKFQHEPMFYAHVKGQSDAWYGDKTQSTLWQVNKPSANKQHPTMKPIELISIALKNSSKSGDTVLDLFLGSGSTLIASEQLKRKCYGMELDPRYVDVIIERYCNYAKCDKEEIYDSAVQVVQENAEVEKG